MEKRRSFKQAVRQTQGAFTLIELVAVIAVVLVLAALLLPAMRGLMQGAGRTDCLSNLRQWAVAVNTYIGENNGSLPLSFPDPSRSGISWNHYEMPLPMLLRETDSASSLLKWRRGESVNGCPEQGNMPYGTGYTYRYYSYVINAHLSNPKLSDKSVYIGKASSVFRPSRTILLTEVALNQNKTEFFNENYQSNIGYKHNQKANALFVDGHIESMTKVELENVLP